MSAKDRIENQITKFFFNDPVLLQTYCLLEKEEDTTIKTVAIDPRGSRPSLKYNPEYINKINDEVLEFVLVSEGFRMLYRHPTTRLKSPRELAALASNLTVNNCLHDCSESKTLTPEMFGIDDFKDNAYYEFFFKWLEENTPKIPSTMMNLEPQKGDSKATKDLKEYMKQLGDTAKYWEENQLMDAEVKELINQNKGSSKQWGKYTGKAVGDIIASVTPKIYWRDILRRFTTSVTTTQQHAIRMKMNRRREFEVPGHRRDYKSKIMFSVDVSGSVSDQDLAEAFSVINSVCKHSELSCVQFDTEIKHIEKKWRKAKDSVKVHGRGGTDFQAIINLAEKENIDGLIIYTDGFADAPTKPSKTKVLWLMTNKQNKPPVDWGEVAHLDRHES
jgi:predicted metal-dependent peptidase